MGFFTFAACFNLFSVFCEATGVNNYFLLGENDW